ncbi:MAG TPA: helix-turn-helix domain-containing protein [Ohtaekwangia sp.]|nr:helix-turn-helix domain-containing protein [Ohtaekwangia sp.]
MEIDIVTKKDLQQFKLELLQELKELIGKDSKPKAEWLRSNEVRKMLKISPGTLQNLRISGALRSTKVGGMHYYNLEDIEKLLCQNNR